MFKMSKEIIRHNSIPGLANAIGPYSTCVECKGLIFISGQVGVSPATSSLISDNVGDQTKQILANISTILSYLKLSPANTIKTTIFLTEMSYFKEVNNLYAEFFEGCFPSRSTVTVSELPLGAKIEIELIISTS
jgi:2-iminobutanoate/2-iminopropanoate deaminase